MQTPGEAVSARSGPCTEQHRVNLALVDRRADSRLSSLLLPTLPAPGSRLRLQKDLGGWTLRPGSAPGATVRSAHTAPSRPGRHQGGGSPCPSLSWKPRTSCSFRRASSRPSAPRRMQPVAAPQAQQVAAFRARDLRGSPLLSLQPGLLLPSAAPGTLSTLGEAGWPGCGLSDLRESGDRSRARPAQVGVDGRPPTLNWTPKGCALRVGRGQSSARCTAGACPETRSPAPRGAVQRGSRWPDCSPSHPRPLHPSSRPRVPRDPSLSRDCRWWM